MPDIITAEFITGCALFIRSTIIKKYGGLTDDFFHGEEDFNFCWRMKKNHIKGKCLNKVLVYHKVILQVSEKNSIVIILFLARNFYVSQRHYMTICIRRELL